MSKEKAEKANITFRLNEEESARLRQSATNCGLSISEFMRQICKGNAPQPMPPKEFWELLNTLYEVHTAFKKCIPYVTSAAEICREIEQLVVDLQQRFTMPQKLVMEELLEKGALEYGNNKPMAH